MWIKFSDTHTLIELGMNKDDQKSLMDWESVAKVSKTLNYKNRRKIIKKHKRKAKRHMIAIKLQTKKWNNTSICETQEGSNVKVMDPFAIGHLMDQVQIILAAEQSGFEKTKQVSSKVPNQIEEDSETTKTAANDIHNPSTSSDIKENGKVSEVIECNTNAKDNEIEALLTNLDVEIEEWHNPYVETTNETTVETVVQSSTFQTPQISAQKQVIEKEIPVQKKERCFFYDTIGCCRFGDECTRRHKTARVSTTILIPGMFKTFGLDMTHRAKRGGGKRGDIHDLGLEYSDDDMYDSFLEFSKDVLRELKKYGKLFQFKVCCNRTKHLQGNVYVEYDKKPEAKVAFEKLNNRFYDGKLLQCKFVKIRSWKKAICGMHYRRGNCSHGDTCNFLHVFKDKSREFHWADQDLY
uniref:ZF(C3H)-13 zinc finger protein n=1 Tax=Phallusia mammillata TaxID=59560 RepID=A0A6F9DX90_9ASCI|nr:ZF(C3H)-13 zinc finger protein [Phallusia mammillata]